MMELVIKESQLKSGSFNKKPVNCNICSTWHRNPCTLRRHHRRHHAVTRPGTQSGHSILTAVTGTLSASGSDVISKVGAKLLDTQFPTSILERVTKGSALTSGKSFKKKVNCSICSTWHKNSCALRRHHRRHHAATSAGTGSGSSTTTVTGSPPVSGQSDTWSPTSKLALGINDNELSSKSFSKEVQSHLCSTWHHGTGPEGAQCSSTAATDTSKSAAGSGSDVIPTVVAKSQGRNSTHLNKINPVWTSLVMEMVSSERELPHKSSSKKVPCNLCSTWHKNGCALRRHHRRHHASTEAGTQHGLALTRQRPCNASDVTLKGPVMSSQDVRENQKLESRTRADVSQLPPLNGRSAYTIGIPGKTHRYLFPIQPSVLNQWRIEFHNRTGIFRGRTSPVSAE